MPSPKLIERLRKIYIEKWPYYNDRPDYSAWKKSQFYTIVDRLRAASNNRPLTIEEPQNETFYYRLTLNVKLHTFPPQTKTPWQRKTKAYLDLFFSECVPAINVQWLPDTPFTDLLSAETGTLFDPGLIQYQEKCKAIAGALLQLIQDLDLEILTQDDLKIIIDPSIEHPQKYLNPHPDNPNLGALVFPSPLFW